MDKTMELVLVALVLMVSAVIVIAMANSQIGGFGDTIDEQRENVGENLSDQLGDVSLNRLNNLTPQPRGQESNSDEKYLSV